MPTKEAKFTLLKQIYLYLVAAVTMIMTIVSTTGLLRIVLNEYVFDVKDYVEMERPKDFWECSDDSLFYVYDEKGVRKLKIQGLNQQAMQIMKEECKLDGIENRRMQHENDVKRDIVFWVSMLVVVLPVFLLHWRMARGSSSENKKK